ncbi:hypothetical protein Tco_0962990, partial [Tanacetum coccineum]
TDSKDEEPEDQGRIFQDIDDDPLGSKGYFVTLTKPVGEAQEEETSPTTLEAAKILSKVASQKSKPVDKGKRYKRRKESKGKDISTGFEEVNIGFEKVNASGSGVSIGSGQVSSARGQREGKAPMIIEETQAPKRTKEQIQQEEASLAEAIRLQTLEEEETAKQIQKYGTNRPGDVYDRVLWSDLRTMFDPPLNEDAIWSLPLQQKIISWRYYDKCEVRCLTLEACSIYMLADRKYPLSKDACQVMLKMKLLDGKMNEVCYKLLKMIEKQAGVRK